MLGYGWIINQGNHACWYLLVCLEAGFCYIILDLPHINRFISLQK